MQADYKEVLINVTLIIKRRSPFRVENGKVI